MKTLRTCKTCGVAKSLACFYRNRRWREGSCKLCKRRAVAENRELKLDHYRAVTRRRNASPKYREARRLYAATPHGRVVMRAARRRYRMFRRLCA